MNGLHPDVMLPPGVDLLFHASDHPLLALGVVFAVVLTTVILITVLKNRKRT